MGCELAPRSIAWDTSGVKRLGIAALAVCTGCAHRTDVRPADVPRLAEIENGQSVWLTSSDGSSVEISRYREVRLVPKSDARGYILRRPIQVQRWEGQLWLKSGSFAPVPFEPSQYSRAEVIHSDRGNTPFIVAGAILGAFVFAIVLNSATPQ